MDEGVSRFNKRLVRGVVFVAFLLFLILYLFLQPSDGQNLPENQLGTPRAAIVDHLSISHPNQGFIETSTSTLTEAGFERVLQASDIYVAALGRRARPLQQDVEVLSPERVVQLWVASPK